MSSERSRDGLIERAMAMLRSQPGRAICMQCLADALSEPRATIHASLVRLEAHGHFQREFGTCAVCDKNRLVLRTKAAS